MFCRYCGTGLPDGAEFCSNCGKTVGNPGGLQKSTAENTVNTEGMNTAQGNDIPANPPTAEGFPVYGAASGGGTGNGFTGGTAGLKSDKKKPKMAGIVVAAVVVAAVVAGSIISRISVNNRIGKLEDAIYGISASADEDRIVELYEEYDSLSDADKRKVANREIIISAYQEIEALIAQRRQAAGQVDRIIETIDYSNIYAEASTAMDAVKAYNNLDEKTREYVESFEKLQKAYDDVKDLNAAITADNFWDLFVLEYSIGDKNNYGGTTISQSGYTIDWDEYGGSITPNYDIDNHNDYAIPVHVYIASRYPNLTSGCSFYINLHQTYNGIGLVDSDVHEFALQAGTIQYDSSQGVGDYIIYVEDNDASNSLLNIFGWSMDWSDMVHEMNPFDVSRIEISDVSGVVSY